MRQKTLVRCIKLPVSRLPSRDSRASFVTTMTRRRRWSTCEFDLPCKQTFASTKRARAHTHVRIRACTSRKRVYFRDSYVYTRADSLTPLFPRGESDYKRMHGPTGPIARRLPLPFSGGEQTEAACLSIKTDLVPVAWSIFHNYSSAS